MPNEFTWEDDEKFKQKLKAQIALCFVFCLLLLGLHVVRSDSVQSLCTKYNDITAKEKWLAHYQPIFKENILAQALRPVTKEKLEAARQGKANLFLKHKLQIENVLNNSTNNSTGAKGMPQAESSADLLGSWPALCSCLADFTKDNLSAVTGLAVSNKNNGQLKIRLTYKIYYR